MGSSRLFLPALLRLLLLALVAWSIPASAPGKDSWVEVRSPNFTVISNSGEKEARRVADQFEQFREVFHASLPQMRIDLGKPLVIFAVKNEDSLKILLPGYWDVKGRAHPSGLYAPGEERHFVALRTNVEGQYPYEVVYHEYTHAIMNLNFRGLPVWLNEGLAELFGNTTIRDKEVGIGRIPSSHLLALQQNRLIPIDQLLTADEHSPYYNEENRVSVFYAESWAIVHYLVMDPEARKRQLLGSFLTAWDVTGDQVQAAQTAFGDLKKFSQAMEAYSRQTVFYTGVVHTSIHADPKSYSSRDLPPAELAANRSFFYLHTKRPAEARASAEEAVQLDANLPMAYEARGLLAYSQQDFPAADAAFSRAIELNSSSYFAYYFDAQARLRRDMSAPEDRAQAIASLEKAVAMNPQFAPAYAALASVYSMQPDTREKAFQAGLKSVKLEPGNLSYAINYAYVLLNAGKTAGARVLEERIQRAVKTPEERAGALALGEAVTSRENYDKQMAEFAERARNKSMEASTEQSSTATSTPADDEKISLARAKPADAATASASSKHANEDEFAVEGIIASVDCNPESVGRLVLTVNNVGMRFTYPSLKALRLVDSVKDITENGPVCSSWKGKHVRLYFYKAKNKPYAGELEAIQFF